MPDFAWDLYPYAHLLGRILFAMIFIASGVNHLMRLDDTAGRAAGRGVPAAKAATAVTGIMILAGGLMVAFGWHRFIGAGLLVLYLVPKAFVMHGFWREQDPVARRNEMSHFMKDLALAGAALLIATYGWMEWPFSLGG